MIPKDFEILSTNILSGIKSFSQYKSDKIILLACNGVLWCIRDSKILKNTTYIEVEHEVALFRNSKRFMLNEML